MSDMSQGLLQWRRNSRDTDWRNYAACLNVDPDLFFPLGTSGASLLQIDEAKRQRRLARTLYPRAFCGPGGLTRVILAGLAPQARRPM